MHHGRFEWCGFYRLSFPPRPGRVFGGVLWCKAIRSFLKCWRRALQGPAWGCGGSPPG